MDLSMILSPLVLAAAVSTAPLPPDVAPLVEAERAFARDVAARGIRDGFAAHMAPKGILFRTGPVDAQAWLAAQKSDTTAKLRWEPSYAEMSTGGDLGWTTGPWEFARKAGEEPVAYGHFTTVWRRQGDGSWRAEIDTGPAHAKGGAEPLAWSRAGDASHPVRTVPKAVRPASEEELLATERAFDLAVSRAGYARAVTTYAGEDLRVGRDGRAPFLTRAAAADSLGVEGKGMKTAWNVGGAGASEAGDLGYTYGTVTPEGGTRQAFLHIWRKVDGNSWRLAHDVTIGAPEPKPAPAAKP